MNIAGIEPRIVASDLSLDRVASNPNISDADKAKEVARQFEAVLLRQILQSAQKSNIKGMFDEDSSSKDVYFDMMNFHMADAITKGGGLGLASAFEAQLKSQMSPAGVEPPENDLP